MSGWDSGWWFAVNMWWYGRALKIRVGSKSMNGLKIKLLISTSLCLSEVCGFFLGRLIYSAPAAEGNLVFATFSGGVVNGKEVLGIIHSEIAAESNAIYETKKRVTLELVRQHLLEIETKKKGQTADQLLA